MENYAPFWKRAAALVVDLMIVTTVLVTVLVAFWPLISVLIWVLNPILTMVVGAEAARHALLLVLKIVWSTVVLVLPVALYGFYFARMESSTLQGGVGKLFFGLRVVDAEGQRLTLEKAWWRYFNKLLSALTLGIGFAMAGFTEKKQALHDLMTGTFVLNK